MNVARMPLDSRRLLPALVALLGLLLADEFAWPEVLLVGDITVDLVDGTTPTGGAVSYAAAALRAYGVRACVVTVAGPDADLSVFDGHELYTINSTSTLTFEHKHNDSVHHRTLTVTANPNVTLTRQHVPRRCQLARTVILGPLTLHDVDAGSFLRYDGFIDRMLRWRQSVGVLAQGYQRDLAEGSTGEVSQLPQPTQQLLDGLGPSVSLFLSDVETHEWSQATLAEVAGRVRRMLVTQGKEGAHEYNITGLHIAEAYPVDQVVNTNGAGDVFATAYMMAQARGYPDPLHHANWAAGQAVRQPQACKPSCVAHHLHGNIQPWTNLERLRVLGQDVGMGLSKAAVRSALQARALAEGLLDGSVKPADLVNQLLERARTLLGPSAGPSSNTQPQS